MAKAILVMDEIPTTCSECSLCGFDGVCHAVHEFCQYRFDKKQEWCPLRECPTKKEVKPLDEALVDIEKGEKTEKVIFEALTNYGYNACIDEILGGGE